MSIRLPILFTHIDKVNSLTTVQGIGKSIGIPGYSNHSYNCIAFTTWTYSLGAQGSLKIWENPLLYLGKNNVFGKTNT